MLIAKQRGDDYRWHRVICKNHNRKMIARGGDIVGKICRKCGVELKATSRSHVEGVFVPSIDGVVITGHLKIKVKENK